MFAVGNDKENEVIRPMMREEVPECVKLIRTSFQTVADEFGFTEKNAPRFTAFATNEDRILWQLEQEQRPMFVYQSGRQIVGYYSLALQEDGACELNNLCVLPAYRHKHIGERMLEDCFSEAKKRSYKKVIIGIVEENTVLKKWYEKHGFKHTGTKKFDFFPFTCGYMEKEL